MTSIIIIWGAFGMTLLLVVAVGAMIQYLKDREKYKKIKNGEWSKVVNIGSTKTPEPAIVKTPDISEPITSFIKCFKENPKRFKVVNGNYLRDTATNVTYVFRIVTEYRGGKLLPRLHNTDKRLQWLTNDEGDALVAAMYPYFATERRDRLHAIQRQRLTRVYKEKERPQCT